MAAFCVMVICLTCAMDYAMSRAKNAMTLNHIIAHNGDINTLVF